MGTIASLLTAVRAAPTDVATRLVYADALDEAGEHIEAAFQRIFAEPDSDGRRLDYATACETEAERLVAGKRAVAPESKLGIRMGELRARAQFVRLQIEDQRADGDFGQMGKLFRPHWLPEIARLPREWRYDENDLAGEGGSVRFRVRRGFVCECLMPVAVWLRHADDVLARHPVRKLLLSTMPNRAWVQENLPPNLRDEPRKLKIRDRALLALKHTWPGVAFELPLR